MIISSIEGFAKLEENKKVYSKKLSWMGL
jgi:hypothetical protein